MSRDFDLLQRLEQEKCRPSIFVEGAGRAPSEKQGETFRVVPKEEYDSPRPSTWLSSGMRAELSKLVLRTFLATPAINSIMFTGVNAKQSAKWLAACTADVLASSSRARVCLLDADLDSPSMHAAYSVPNHSGLGEVLSGRCSIDRAAVAVAENLWLIPAGERGEIPTITVERIRQIFYDLQQDCEYLIVSGPEQGNYPEVAAVGAAAGAAILVLDATTTQRASALRAKAILEAAQVRIIGSVMTNQHDLIPDFLSSHIH